MELNSKVAVVTGAASGIGKAIASRFVEAGARVVLCDRNEEALAEVSRELDGARWLRIDVSDEDQVEAAVRHAEETFGSLDVVVNCAGFGRISPLTDLSKEDWAAVHAVTLSGVFFGVKQAARRMLAGGRRGVILNISSVNGRTPGEGQIAYCSAKAGVDMLTRCASLELAPHGIRVVGLAPGLVETPLTSPELKDPAKRALFLGAIPAGRAAQPREIADIAVFLCSDKADYVNGETLGADGGLPGRSYPALLTGTAPSHSAA